MPGFINTPLPDVVDILIMILTTIIVSMLSSGVIWKSISAGMDKKDSTQKLIVGIAHELIISKGMVYVERGFITEDEYRGFTEYLCKPYFDMGGNGSARRVYDEVCKLPIHTEKYLLEWEMKNNVKPDIKQF